MGAEDPEAEAAHPRQRLARPRADEKRRQGPGAEDAGDGREAAQRAEPGGEFRAVGVEGEGKQHRHRQHGQGLM